MRRKKKKGSLINERLPKALDHQVVNAGKLKKVKCAYASCARVFELPQSKVREFNYCCENHWHLSRRAKALKARLRQNHLDNFYRA